ncbi:MAG TPA: hypothetical protein VGR77_00355 [Candidatus Dormibacteraeota bacterium]|nr:hypothetical protein [Candidatus Dormibacteraeota bacterium]
MTSLTGTRRWLVIGIGAGACLVIGMLAAGSLRQLGQAVTTPPEPCSPHPCAAPHAFEVVISDITATNGIVMLHVTFHNRSKADPFEAVSYDHTSPADFQLRSAAGQQRPPAFSGQCPDWGELRIEHSASAGPKPLCFAAAHDGLKGALLVWSPDLGLLFDDVRIPLN